MLAALMGAMAMATWTAAQEGFIDHGVGAPAAESRGAVCLEDANGRAVVVCCAWDQSPRGWVLVTDIDSGETQQVFYPEGVPNSAPFASLLSSNGRFYTFAGKVLLEFEPGTREWRVSGTPAPSEDCYCGSAMCDGPDGRIYAGGYPNCKLVSFDPETQEMKDLGKLDPAEHYVMSLVADSSGWLYAGIGTARQNIVACDPRTGEMRQLVDEADRKLGSASVYLGQDGKAYGQCAGKWFRLFEGQAEEIAADKRAPAQPTGAIGWGQTTGAFPDGRRLKAYNLPERYLEVQDPKTGEVKRLTFDYESEGAMITSLTVGPKGLVYGSSAHPMHMFVCDPETGKLTDWGGIPRVGGGNFCAMATQGQYLFGAAYAGAFLYRYDSAKPWNGETGDDPNPKLVARFEGDVTRPRACIAHPDGKHVIMAGFMGYGMRGGGLGIYNNETGEATLLKHTDVIPDQSTIALVALPNGDLVGGTSIQTPGGGHPTEKEGVLYILDWATKRVTFRMVPVPGAPEVYSLALGADGMVYGIASNVELFVFDPARRQVIHRASLAEYGGLPRQVLVRGEDDRLFAILSKSILRIQPGTFAVEKLADAPVGITAGVAVTRGRLYFASGSHLWSCGL
jgi:outer membrane protein assembly factor BamB